MNLPKIYRGKTFQEQRQNSIDHLIKENDKSKKTNDISDNNEINRIYNKLLKLNFDEIEKNSKEIKDDLRILENLKLEKEKKQKNFKEPQGEKEKENNQKEIEDKINIIRIYLDLLNIYQEDIVNNPISKILENITDDISFKKKVEENIELFDILCKRIKINLFINIEGKSFANLFFSKYETSKINIFN